MSKKKALPPRYFSTSIVIIIAAHLMLPIATLIEFPWNLIGLPLILIGGLMNLIADKDFKSANTTVKPFEYSEELITDGIFRVTRNPMYLGMALFLLGESILAGSITPFLITIIFIFLMDKIFITNEEQMLAEKFGVQYNDYKKNVRKWI
ncbi:MAG: isoprenylcysteine carboxylmethyltransferase family protein [Melioribacteraceae bacterium]|nr:isoprenylcysteine carboxylmethyltransferase family protein [Melioribacteraceae bacterium]